MFTSTMPKPAATSPKPPAPQTGKITAACRMIEAADTAPSLAALAQAAGLSPFHFHRLFKAVTGVTPKAYARAQKAARLRAALATAPRVTDAIYEAGYNSSGRFYETSNATLGMTPKKFRRQGEGMQITFALGECSLGSILVAQTARGICAIALGDEPETLLNQLQARFPAANFTGGDPDFDALVAQVVGFIETPGQDFALPLDIRGTAFQQRVWQALRAIPPGKTTTYSEIAAAIGAPRAIRAVATACAANNLAVAIPCHRVIRLSGDLAGYRWGVDRKHLLLEREAGYANAARAGQPTSFLNHKAYDDPRRPHGLGDQQRVAAGGQHAVPDETLGAEGGDCEIAVQGDGGQPGGEEAGRQVGEIFLRGV